MVDLLKIIYTCSLLIQCYAFPEKVTDRNSFIVQPLTDTQSDSPTGKEASSSTGPPKIYEMHIDSNVSNRFAHTLVTSKVKNEDTKAQEAIFSIILPKKAFISKFVMKVGGKDYKAYVKEKNEAQNIYDQALSSGRGAGLVAANTRDSNRFTVSVNVERESKVTFLLTYEQLLEREDNQYELVINIHPKQEVDDLSVLININESQPLMFVRAPPIKSGNEISKIEGNLDPRAQIHQNGPNSATIKFSPNKERQKEIAQILGTNVDEGLSGQFLIQYDVERNLDGGVILLRDGYFVHFFAPPHIKPLPKYVLFVLDTSGSMYGTKMEQLKTAMTSILNELKDHDKFHLIDFDNVATVLDLQNQNTVQYPSTEYNYDFIGPFSTEDINVKNFVSSFSVNSNNIQKANETVQNMEAEGGTNIADALKVALHLVEIDKKNNPSDGAPQPIIIFLTDGDATVGTTDQDEILSLVEQQNKFKVPIYSLSFGDGADTKLLQKLSLSNNGFSRHIYEAADAALQLKDFYNHISSPILTNVTFKYIDEAKEITKTNFPILFEGSELVVAGQLGKDFDQLPTITAETTNGTIHLMPEVRRPVTQIEKLWAYLTIHQLLDEVEISNNKTQIAQKALNLAKKYSFVTPLTSLVVVKPNGSDSSVILLPADKDSVDASPTALGLSIKSMYALPESLDYETEFFPTEDPEILTTTKLTPFEELRKGLPWLNTTLSDNDTIVTFTGEIYKLGLNETSTDDIDCPATPTNGPGICKLLHECYEVHHLFTNIYIFQQFHCDIKGLAGICCPRVRSN